MLFLYELKKLYKSRIFLIILALFIVFDFFCVYNTCRPYFSDNTYKSELKLTDRFEGRITRERVDEITENYSRLADLVDSNAYNTNYDSSTYTGYEYLDYNVLLKLNDELSRIYNFSANTNEKINAINSSADFLSNNGNDFLAEKYRRTASSIEHRQITEIHNYSGVNEYMNYDMSVIFVMLSAVFVSVISFSKDKELVDTVYTCSYSKTRICSAKIMSVIFNSVFISILFRLFDLILFNSFIGLRGITSPLFYLEKYEMTYFSGSILSFSFLQTIELALLTVVAAMLCSCISIIIQRAEFSLILSVLTALLIYLNGFISNDFDYPKYLGFMFIGYAKLFVLLAMFVLITISTKILHKGMLKNGNLKI
ncbi:hypothetical protein [uncultured Eubacterium sp.]|uniref:hypothetical protein n=1 Tax=uncultured Eubacterium sp. TaxID=165185 RepID=UPI0015ACDD19|nr:hypothetical protein [uncultured Eubacterium sp.]